MNGMPGSERYGWHRALAVLWLCIALAALPDRPAVAQEIAAADRAAIAARIVEFDGVMKEQRFGEVLDFMPPRMLAMIAGGSGISPEKLKEAMTGQIAEAMKIVKIVAFKMDINASAPLLTPDRQRGYMLIPTETIMEIPSGQRLRSRSSTVALSEGARWYLIRIDNAQQVSMLQKTYPEFAGVEFPSGSTSVLE